MPLPRLDTWDDVAAHLRRLRSGAGSPTYRELVRRVRDLRAGRGLAEADAPGHSTVHDCFRDGRRRMDLDLLADLGRALGLGVAEAREWDSSCFAVQNRVDSARVVSVSDEAHRTPSFVGRADELARVRAAPGTWAITGLPGVGKSQLALRLADAWLADGTADRLVVADLRGYHEDRAPADGEAMLAELLRVLSGAVITDPDAARRRLGDDLASARCVLLLDDAASQEQLAAILPPAPTTPIVITSRRRVDLPHVAGLRLAPLDRHDALGLLETVAGSDRMSADPESATQIVTALGGLPLALDVTARRIASSPSWTLDDHRAALVEQADVLRLPGPLEPAFTLSYERLSPGARRILRLLAQQPGSSYAAPEIAVLVDLEVEMVDALLAELAAASLVNDAAGRIGLHDQIRTYASAASLTEDPPTQREQARGRLLDHCLRMAAEAVAACGLTPLVSRRDYEPPETVLGHEEALTWLAAERENLLALADPRLCATRPDYPVRMSACLCKLLDVQGQFREGAHLHRQALAVTERSGDLAGQARSHTLLGQLLHRFDQTAAEAHLTRALALVDVESDPDSHASAAIALGILASQAGDFDTAESYQRLALETVLNHDTTRRPGPIIGNLATILVAKGDLEGAARQHRLAHRAAEEDDDRESAAIALSNLASVHFELGDHAAAKEAAEAAVGIARSIGSQTSYAVARINLAEAMTMLGEYAEARGIFEAVLADVRRDGHLLFEVGGTIAYGDHLLATADDGGARTAYEHAGRLAEGNGFRYWVGRHHLSLGDLESALGDPAAARSRYREALGIFDQLGTGEADEVRRKLSEVSDERTLSAGS